MASVSLTFLFVEKFNNRLLIRVGYELCCHFRNVGNYILGMLHVVV